MPDKNEFALDEDARAYITELNQQIQAAATSMNAALSLVCRQNKLPGQWRLSPCGKKLVRQDLPEQPAFTKKSPRKQ